MAFSGSYSGRKKMADYLWHPLWETDAESSTEVAADSLWQEWCGATLRENTAGASQGLTRIWTRSLWCCLLHGPRVCGTLDKFSYAWGWLFHFKFTLKLQGQMKPKVKLWNNAFYYCTLLLSVQPYVRTSPPLPEGVVRVWKVLCEYRTLCTQHLCIRR